MVVFKEWQIALVAVGVVSIVTVLCWRRRVYKILKHDIIRSKRIKPSSKRITPVQDHGNTHASLSQPQSYVGLLELEEDYAKKTGTHCLKRYFDSVQFDKQVDSRGFALEMIHLLGFDALLPLVRMAVPKKVLISEDGFGIFNKVCQGVFSPAFFSGVAVTRQKSLGGRTDAADPTIKAFTAGHGTDFAEVFEEHLAGDELLLPDGLVTKVRSLKRSTCRGRQPLRSLLLSSLSSSPPYPPYSPHNAHHTNHYSSKGTSGTGSGD
jgi:hypothetical protein